jgi:hypothetical protein
MSIFPCFGGGTSKILQASSRLSPPEFIVLPAPGFPAAAAAYFCEADACLYASVNARPTILAPVKTAWVMMRCAYEDLSAGELWGGRISSYHCK